MFPIILQFFARDITALAFPIIIFGLALVLRKLELSLAGSAYWKETQSNYWLLLVLWGVSYVFLYLDCNARPVFGEATCSVIGQVLLFVFSALALYAAFQWYKLAQKRTEFLKKMKV